MSNSDQGGTTGIHLLLAWVFVGVPLAWGLYQTVLKAIPIFSKIELTSVDLLTFDQQRLFN